MEVGKLKVDLKDGELQMQYPLAENQFVKMSVPVAAAANPLFDSLIAKVESGEIDPIKGTDLDKVAMLQALQFLKSEVNK